MTDHADEMPSIALGKRYYCASCAAEFLCVKPGSGNAILTCCGATMQLRAAKLLPSSD